MYLFGFPEGLAGGSKETSYITNYNTSRSTSRTTGYNTGWTTGWTTSRATSRTTSRGTSRTTTVSTSWSSVGNTSWNTAQTTSKNTAVMVSGHGVNIDGTVAGADLSKVFWIYESSTGAPLIRAFYGWYNKDLITPVIANDGTKFLPTTGVTKGGFPTSASTIWDTVVKDDYLRNIYIWLDGSFRGIGSTPDITYDECYNCAVNGGEIRIVLSHYPDYIGFKNVTITMTGINRPPFSWRSGRHFYPNVRMHQTHNGSNPTGRPFIVGDGNGIAPGSFPYGTTSTSYSTAGPLTYQSTSYALSKNTSWATGFNTSYGTGWNTSFGTARGTSKGTSRGTSFTTTFGTAHTTDHITYG